MSAGVVLDWLIACQNAAKLTLELAAYTIRPTTRPLQIMHQACTGATLSAGAAGLMTKNSYL